ncbi:4a-hydroxytetrahydrobiopterin dehydratase [Salsuginibacillus halophilus]|uniref:4a-hydroxytetrahydrobiopterin dehydratase n=1 Tax=Salsuginibacillus halophilus TaxID=517424 RepID=A0A2P8HXL3_9BACI|nr:4a-hydroxytetrahydrobiopterin dehydratase [Salsuginibacillus halophilus]PSL50973.1 4a-hydroxytetrahydrobiopterin dehydratase [Salsuginibacillus halophilus]
MGLTRADVEQQLAEMNGWTLTENDMIERVYEFQDFLTGIAFVKDMADYAEHVQHHPQIVIDHTNITVRLKTFDQNAITEKDLSAAAAFNEKYSAY